MTATTIDALRELLRWLRSWEDYYRREIDKYGGDAINVTTEPLMQQHKLFKARADAVNEALDSATAEDRKLQ